MPGACCIILSTLFVAVALSAASINVNCAQWVRDSEFDVVVAGQVYFGTRCNAALTNVSITFYCYPQSSITIDGWIMRGGHVTILGPPAAPWNVSDVSVTVRNAAINVTNGPAVGVVVGVGFRAAAPAGQWAVGLNNVSFTAINSKLTSTAISACALGVVVDSTLLDVTIDQPSVTLTGLRTLAVDCVLHAFGGETAVTLAFAARASSSTIAVVNCIFQMLRCTVVTTAPSSIQGYGVASVGGIAVGRAFGRVSITNIVSLADRSSIESESAVSLSGASCVCGISIGAAIDLVEVTSAQLYVISSNVTSISTASGEGTASSVAGVAVGTSPTPSAVISKAIAATVWNSDVASHSSVRSHAGSVSTVGGVAVGTLNQLTTATASLSVLWSSISSVSASNGHSASSIGGVATGFCQQVTVTDVAMFMSNATAMSRSTASVYYSASSIAAVVGGQLGGLNVGNVTSFVGWTNATSTGIATSNDGCGSGVAGIVIGAGTSGYLHVVTLCVINSTVASEARAGNNGAASSVVGVVVGFSYYTLHLPVIEVLLYVGSSDVAAIAVAPTAASSAGGVAAFDGSPVLTNVTTALSQASATACCTTRMVSCVELHNTALQNGTCCTNTTDVEWPAPFLAAPGAPAEWLRALEGRRRVSATPSSTHSKAAVTITRSAESTATHTPSGTPTALVHPGVQGSTRTLESSLSQSAFGTLSTDRPVPPPPPPPRKKVHTITALPDAALRDPTPKPTSAAAEAAHVIAVLHSPVSSTILAAGYGSAAIAAALSPTQGNKAVPMARVTQSAMCAALDPTTSFPSPSEWTLLPGGEWFGSDDASVSVSMVLTTAVAGLLVELLHLCAPNPEGHISYTHHQTGTPHT